MAKQARVKDAPPQTDLEVRRQNMKDQAFREVVTSDEALAQALNEDDFSTAAKLVRRRMFWCLLGAIPMDTRLTSLILTLGLSAGKGYAEDDDAEDSSEMAALAAKAKEAIPEA